jgi:hypothetical protein
LHCMPSDVLLKPTSVPCISPIGKSTAVHPKVSVLETHVLKGSLWMTISRRVFVLPSRISHHSSRLCCCWHDRIGYWGTAWLAEGAIVPPRWHFIRPGNFLPTLARDLNTPIPFWGWLCTDNLLIWVHLLTTLHCRTFREATVLKLLSHSVQNIGAFRIWTHLWRDKARRVLALKQRTNSQPFATARTTRLYSYQLGPKRVFCWADSVPIVSILWSWTKQNDSSLERSGLFGIDSLRSNKNNERFPSSSLSCDRNSAGLWITKKCLELLWDSRHRTMLFASCFKTIPNHTPKRAYFQHVTWLSFFSPSIT